MTRIRFVMLLSVLLAIGAPGLADSVRIGRVTVPDVEVLGIGDGVVVYRVGFRTEQRPIDDTRLYLDAVPELERGERRLDAVERDEAIAIWSSSLETIEDPWRRAWVNHRLSNELDRAGRFTEAAGAWARVVADAPDAWWLTTSPRSAPDQPRKSTAAAALADLRTARQVLDDEMLVARIDELLTQVERVHAAATESTDDTDLAADPNTEPLDDTPAVEETPPPTTDLTEVEETRSPDDRSAPPVAAIPSPADDVDALIAAGEYREARMRIERLVADPADYPIDRLLFQYGLVLRESGQFEDAAIRLMQAAILYPSSSVAAEALEATASIYETQFKNTRIAERLRARAREASAALERR
ncbi:MAG: hypothetical protein ACF8PN_03535 [Phycisphaerales bacterium]